MYFFHFSERRCLGQGTLHQGEVVGGGVQCTCIALCFICLESSGILKTKMNFPETIDRVINEGTTLYTSHFVCREAQTTGKKTSSYLMIDELPDIVQLGGNTYTVKRLEPVYTGLIGTATSDTTSLTYSLYDAVDQVFKVTNSCFMTLGPPMSACTSALCKVDNTFVCFDSHSRIREGLSSHTGKGVLIETVSLTSLVKYITDLAASLFSSPATTQFEFVAVISLNQTILTGSDNPETIIKQVRINGINVII